MHCMPACFFGISATPAGGAEQSFVLSSPETYTEANICLPSATPACVSPSSVRRLESLPGIKVCRAPVMQRTPHACHATRSVHSALQGLTIVGKYPIADVAYDIPGGAVRCMPHKQPTLTSLDSLLWHVVRCMPLVPLSLRRQLAGVRDSQSIAHGVLHDLAVVAAEHVHACRDRTGHK
jgi:hypothetical protein